MKQITGAYSIELLIQLGQLYGQARNLRLSTIGKLAANDGKFFIRLIQGHSCTIKRMEKILIWFDDHWPDGIPWPEHLSGPVRLPQVKSENLPPVIC